MLIIIAILLLAILIHLVCHFEIPRLLIWRDRAITAVVERKLADD